MISLLVSWYAFGWVAVLLWCRESDEMSMLDFISCLLGGPASVFGFVDRPDVTIWRRKT